MICDYCINEIDHKYEEGKGKIKTRWPCGTPMVKKEADSERTYGGSSPIIQYNI